MSEGGGGGGRGELSARARGAGEELGRVGRRIVVRGVHGGAVGGVSLEELLEEGRLWPFGSFDGERGGENDTASIASK